MEAGMYMEDLVSGTYHTVHSVWLRPNCTWPFFYDTYHRLVWSDFPGALSDCYMTYLRRKPGIISLCIFQKTPPRKQKQK
jgi:hypothetical protein